MSTIKVEKAKTVHCENPVPPENGDTVIIEAPKQEKTTWHTWGPVAALAAAMLCGGLGFWIGRESASSFDCRKISIGKTGIIHNSGCMYYKKGTIKNCEYCGGIHGK